MPLFDCSPYEDRLLERVLEFQEHNAAGACWIRSGETSVTFSQAAAVARARAAQLHELGVREGDVVAAYLPPSIDTVLFGLGTILAGGIYVVIDTELSGAYLAERLAEVNPRVTIVHETLSDAYASAIQPDATQPHNHPHTIICTNTTLDSDLATVSRVVPGKEPSLSGAPSPGTPALAWWTSGTTGKPKGVVHTQSSMLFQAWNAAKRHRSGDVFYCCTPMYLGGAWFTAILPTLVAGTTIAIDPAFSVSRYWDRIRYYGATIALLLGAMHEYILAAPPKPNDADNPLRCAYCIPISQTDAVRFQQRFNVESTPQMYGMSETGMICDLGNVSTWGDNEMGLPTPHYEVQLVDDNGAPVERGQVGELCVRPLQPDIMFLEYFNDPQASLSVMRNLWFHCGDTAYMDEAGRYHFYGRKKDYIRHKGRNVALHQVDCLAQTQAGVLEAAAFGVQADDERTEEEIALAVVFAPGASPDVAALIAAMDAEAPYYLVPRYVTVLDNLPKNKHGRVVKNQLKPLFNRESAWDSHQHGYNGRRRKNTSPASAVML